MRVKFEIEFEAPMDNLLKIQQKLATFCFDQLQKNEHKLGIVSCEINVSQFINLRNISDEN